MLTTVDRCHALPDSIDCLHGHPALCVRSRCFFTSVLGEPCPTAPAVVVFRTPGSLDLRRVGMDSASHDIRLRRSTLVLLNVPFWRTSEESLIERLARTEQPEEFQPGEDHINVDIADFICGQRRF